MPRIPSQPESSYPSESHWARFRTQMPIANEWAYFDHAAVAPLPLPAEQAIQSWLRSAVQAGDTDWPNWNRRLETFRDSIAGAIHASPSEIALVPNTTSGLSLLAEGYPWEEGDNVVTLENEFPSNLYPWLHLASRGVSTRQVPVPDGYVDLDKVASACDNRTRIVSLSWVGYASGWRIDVSRASQIAHECGALFCLDAIQGLGLFPLDVESDGVDFLAADGHKWLLGPEGAGVCFVREGLLDQLRPVGVGWNSVQSRYDFAKPNLVLRESAARFESGSANMIGYHGLAASFDLLTEFGLDASRTWIGDRITALADQIADRVETLGGTIPYRREVGHKSGIVTVTFPRSDPAQIRAACLEKKIVVSCRGGGIRVAPHVYNNEADIDRFIEVVRQFC